MQPGDAILHVSCAYVNSIDDFLFSFVVILAATGSLLVSFFGTWKSVVKALTICGVLGLWFWLPYDGFYEGHPALVCNHDRYRTMPLPGMSMAAAFFVMFVVFNLWDSGQQILRKSDNVLRQITWLLMTLFFVHVWVAVPLKGLIKFPEPWMAFWVVLGPLFVLLPFLLVALWRRRNLERKFLLRFGVSFIVLSGVCLLAIVR
jgi:hypothetical protein